MYKEHSLEIDLMILDYVMPEMNGLEVFKKLKAFNQKVSVLISTGFSKEEGIKEMEASGIDDFVNKPFNLNTLSIELSEIVQNKS